MLPYGYPESLRGEDKAADRWPISRLEHAALQKRIFKELGLKGKPFFDLRPGDSFQPCYLDIPSRPRADFLWSSAGVLVVSERIKELFVELCRDEIAACPIILRKVGKREAKLRTPMPTTGEPEDMIHGIPLLDDNAGVGPYYEIVPLKKSEIPRNRPVKGVCSGCQRQAVEVIYPLYKNRPRMTVDVWRGHSIFLMATTLYVIVTDEVKQVLSRMRPTNLRFVDAA